MNKNGLKRCKLWLAAPITVDIRDVKALAHRLADAYGVDVDFWDRGEYDESKLENSTALVVWACGKFNFSSVPVGIKAEITRATRIGKPIYLAYKPTNLNTEILYEWDRQKEGGIAGTAIPRRTPTSFSPLSEVLHPDIPEESDILLLLIG
jgi:hypothetical protein